MDRKEAARLKALKMRESKPFPHWFIEDLEGSPDKELVLNCYKSVNDKAIFICKIHGPYEQKITHHLNRGDKCPKCSQRNNTLQKTLRRKYGYRNLEYLSTASNFSEDLKSDDILIFNCPLHGEYRRTLIQADTYPRCPRCSKSETTRKNELARREKYGIPDDILNQIIDDELRAKVISREIPLTSKLEFRCENEHIYSTRLSDRLNGHGCPTCAAQRVDYVSSYEKRISAWLTLHGIKHECSCRTEVKSENGRNLELDIYISEYKLAIEVNGLYWHSIEHMLSSKTYNAAGGKENYHLMKTKVCGENGIQLIHLFEDDLRDKWDLCLNLLKSKLYLRGCRVFSRVKIGARSLDVRKFDNGREFFDKYHINGYGRGNCYGLFDGNNLISAIQVRRTPSNEDNAENSFILDRYCTVFDMNVVGGIERLMKFAEKDLNIKKWISYADITISDGALYKRLGFDLIGTSKPDYRYVYKGIRIHKFNFRIKRFRDDESLIFEEGKSESQLAEMNGLKKIYDCGKLKFVKLL